MAAVQDARESLDYKVVARLPKTLASDLQAIAAETGASLNTVIVAALTHAAAHPSPWAPTARRTGDRRRKTAD